VSDENYPNPECPFGVAIQQDIQHIKQKIETILKRQEGFDDTLQNGLSTQVKELRSEVDDLQQKRKDDEKEEEEKQKREDRRDWEFKKMLIATLLGNILALGGGVLIGFLGFN